MISRREALLGSVILFVLINVVFAPFLWGDRSMMSSSAETSSIFAVGAGAQPLADIRVAKTLDPGAPGWQTEPEFFLEHALESHGSPPLWNPYVAFGQPLAANMQSQPYYPLAWIVELYPSPRTYDWFVALRFWVAAEFAFLFLGYFIGFVPALGGGIAFGLTGYLVVYYNMPEVSVEALVPALLWGVERLVRFRNWSTVGVLALVTASVVFGGMPESALLAFACAAAFAVVRIFTDPVLATERRSLAIRCAAGFGLGGVISAILILPFVEFMRISYNSHIAIGTVIPGLGADGWNIRFFVPYVMPLVNGPPWNNIFNGFGGHSGIRGYWGIAATYLALIAVVSRFIDWQRRRGTAWSPEAFFAITATVLVLKRFGSPLVNWLGFLPGFRVLNFPKYDEAVIGMCVAALAGFGIERLANGRASRSGIFIATLTILTLLTDYAGVVKPAFAQLTMHRSYLLLAFGWALIVLSAAFALAWLSPRVQPRLVSIGAAALIAADLLVCYLVPMWWIVNGEPPMARNGGNGAPYASYVQQQTARTYERFIGLDSLLFPEWAAAFGIFDVRDLNALYAHRYLPFVRTFLARDAAGRTEMADRFTGGGITRLDDPLSRRFLSLASIRYIGAQHDMGDLRNNLLVRAIRAIPERLGPALRAGSFTIEGVARQGVLMHPPQAAVPYAVTIPKNARALRFSFGEDSTVYADAAHLCGAGVGFTISYQGASGAGTQQLFHRYIDPKHVLAQRKWFEAAVDVSKLAGRHVTLLFSTDAGPKADTCAAWAVWGPVRFDPTAPSPFSTVSQSPDAQVIRYADPLPRLALYTRAATAADDDTALQVLASPDHDIRRVGVVTVDGADGKKIATDLAAGPASPVVAGRIEFYDSRDVRATVNAPARALAVLNDTEFPGWRATVDGTTVPIVVANGMFRGIEVPAGLHTIEFRYEPRSFVIGLIGTIAGLLTSIALLFGELWTRLARRVYTKENV